MRRNGSTIRTNLSACLPPDPCSTHQTLFIGPTLWLQQFWCSHSRRALIKNEHNQAVRGTGCKQKWSRMRPDMHAHDTQPPRREKKCFSCTQNYSDFSFGWKATYLCTRWVHTHKHTRGCMFSPDVAASQEYSTYFMGNRKLDFKAEQQIIG